MIAMRKGSGVHFGSRYHRSLRPLNADPKKTSDPVGPFAGLVVGLACLAAQVPARAENIDLSTVPNRATVQLTIYNSEDITLVRETRKVSFKPGVNPLQFSWANTLIDPTSVEL